MVGDGIIRSSATRTDLLEETGIPAEFSDGSSDAAEDIPATFENVKQPSPDGVGPQPAAEDIFVSRGGGAFNPIKEFVTGSGRPEEYLPRTNVKDNEVMDFCDVWSQIAQMTLGYIDLHQEMWNLLLLRRSINQSALNMGKEMFIGERSRQFAMRAGMFHRANTINREQFTQER